MLGLELTETEGFRLILATYDDPRRRDELIDRLAAEGRTRRLLVTRLDLAALGRGTVLLRALREHVAATKPPPGWRRAVMVVGLEDLLDYSRIGARADALTVLHDANLHRDAFPAACPAPVVIWLSPIATSAFAQAAPDLWHWRTATFDFTGGPGRRVGILEEALSRREHRSDDVPRDVLERRVALLHELLLEIDREGTDSPGRRARKATLLDQLAWTYILLNRPSDALRCAEDQLAIAREIGDRRGEGSALGNLGIAYADLGEPRRAIELHEQWLAIAREIGDRRGEGDALYNLGIAYADLGEPRRAVELYEQLLAVAREIGARRGEGHALGNLGAAYAKLGEPRRAIDFAEQQLEITREVGDRRGEGHALGNLGIAYADLGEPRRAIDLYEQWLAITREVGDRQCERSALGSLGIAYAELGEPRRAIDLFEQQLEITREMGNRRGEGRALFNSGLALDTLGDRAAAMDRVRAALAIFEQIEDAHLEQARATLAEWEAEARE